MSGITELSKILAEMEPILNNGDYVFVTVEDSYKINLSDSIATFKEKESTTLILEKNKADLLHLKYNFVASWITLNVHSSLEAVGLTAAISKSLAEHQISCNVVAAYFHDHIFIAKKDTIKAMKILQKQSL